MIQSLPESKNKLTNAYRKHNRKMYNPTIVHARITLESTEPYFASPPTQSLATGLLFCGIGLSPIHYMKILVSGEKKGYIYKAL